MVKNNNLQNWNQESRSLPSPAKKVSECLREHIRFAASGDNTLLDLYNSSDDTKAEFKKRKKKKK